MGVVTQTKSVQTRVTRLFTIQDARRVYSVTRLRTGLSLLITIDGAKLLNKLLRVVGMGSLSTCSAGQTTNVQ